MSKELHLHIDFIRELNEKEQNDFWDNFVESIENMNLYAGGGHDSYYLDWVLDYRDSQLEKDQIIEMIKNFLKGQVDLVLKFNIK